MIRLRFALVAALLATGAWAQDDAAPSTTDALDTIQVETDTPATPPPVLPEAGGPRELDDIVVTAQKTLQSIQQVPVSVTAIDKAQIQATGSNDLADLSLYVPNIRIDADDLGSPQIFIRGFGTNAFNPSFESSVGFVQDELYFGRPGYFTEAMFDVDRVEVLRGPQGTLFGKNTIAGVFNITSVSPGEELDVDLQYKGGSNGEQAIEAAIGGPLGEWGGVRLSGLYRNEDGETFNQLLGRMEDALEQQAVRLKFKFYPSLGISSELTLVDSKTEAPFWPFQLARLDQDTREYLEQFDPDIEDDPHNFVTSFNTAGYIEKGSTTAGLKTDWEWAELGPLSDFHTVLVVGGSKFFIDQFNELDVSPADLANLDSHEDHEQLSAELRFTGRAESLLGLGGNVEFVGGLFWYQSSYTLLAQIIGGADLGSFFLTCDFLQLASGDTSLCPQGTFGIPALPVVGLVTGPVIGDDRFRFDYDQDVTAYAAFGQFTWYLDDAQHWAITPGVRLNREEKVANTSGHASCPGREAIARPCVIESLLMTSDYPAAGDTRPLVREESDVSPKLVLQYFTDGGTNLYVSYAAGYKSGGFNSLSYNGEDLEFEPEEASTYELGLKGKYFDKTLRLALTLYDTDFENLQVLAFDGPITFVSNAAAAYSRGLEAEATWLTPLEFLSFTGSLGLMEARYKNFTAPAPISEGIGTFQELGGKTIAFAPETTATITPILSFPIGSWMLRISGDAIYQGDQYTDTDLDPNTFQPAYWKYAARVILGSQDERWALIVGGNNLTDERILNQVTDATLFPGTYFAQQAAGRSVFATLALKL